MNLIHSIQYPINNHLFFVYPVSLNPPVASAIKSLKLKLLAIRLRSIARSNYYISLNSGIRVSHYISFFSLVIAYSNVPFFISLFVYSLNFSSIVLLASLHSIVIASMLSTQYVCLPQQSQNYTTPPLALRFPTLSSTHI